VAEDTPEHRIGDNMTDPLPKNPGSPLLLPAMTSESATSSRPAARGGLFDATFYQVWALDADDSWEYLPTDATPDAWRDRTREGALRCPYPDCGAAFSAVRRGAGRVAFVHPKTGGTHSDKQAKETLWSLAATQTVLRWAATAYPDATATAGATTDVQLTLADGTRFAVECRYSALTADEWAKQHQAYEEQGVTDVWLFGHAGVYARKAAAGTDLLKPPQPLADLIDADTTAGWLNPFLGLVGFPDRTDAGITARTLTIDEWRLPVTEAALSDSDPAPADEPAVEPATSEPEPAAAEEPAAESAPAAAPESEPAAADEPAVEPAAVEEPAAEAEPAAEPATAEAAAAEPAAPEPPTAEEPAATEEPAADEPSAEEPAVEESDAEEPAAVAGTTPLVASGSLRDRQHQIQGWFRKMIGKLRRPAA
jgi:hypothetical protein